MDIDANLYLAHHGLVALWIIAIAAVLAVLILLAIWIRLRGVTGEWRADRAEGRRARADADLAARRVVERQREIDPPHSQ